MKGKSAKKVMSVYSVLIIILSVLAIVSIYLLLALTELPKEFSVAMPALIYIISVLIIFFVRLIKSNSKNSIADEIESNFESITKEFMINVNCPLVMCDKKGRILWYNNAFFNGSKSKTHLYGKFLDNVTDATIERIVKDETPEGAYVKFSSPESENIRYKSKGYPVKVKNEDYTMVILNDNSKVDKLKKTLENEDVVVSYIAIDNADDVSRITNTSTDIILMNIKTELKNYTDKYDGILRDNGKNRYLFIFSRKFLKPMMDEKFVILDSVRAQSKNISSPITISIGVADVAGSLEDKSEIALQALELALQRGGDQVVIKGTEKVLYYGGRTKGVSNGSGVRGRVLANEFKSLVKASKNVLVMGHRNADFDAIGSAIGISRICKYLDVKVNVICDRKDKNLEEVFKMLEDNEYKTLFVSAAEAQELITSETLAVVCDVNNIPISEAPDVVNSAKHIVIIDHHRKTQEFAFEPDIQYIEPNVSSASELVSEFLQHLLPQKAIPKVEANLLYAGISLDTKKLTHNAGVKTFVALQYLREVGADPEEVERLFKITLKELSSEAEFERNTVIFKSVIAVAYYENKSNSPLARVSAARAADKMLTVKGIEAGFALCKIGDSIHISARSTGRINVQLILEKIGGGGHFDSAGALVHSENSEEVLVMLENAINDYYKDINN